ncbi:MAG: nitroreductase [Coriobacteriaceae bacterium]|nr:nitroreductase [Coriobacteriaceae bacterium]
MSHETDRSVPRWNAMGMPDRRVFLLVLGTLIAGLAGCGSRRVRDPGTGDGAAATPGVGAGAALPDPVGADVPGGLLDAIEHRRSLRDFADKAVPDEQITRMLWAAQGITDPVRGLRAAPSAGALYPLELYVASAEGVHHYLPERHALERVGRHDVRDGLAAAALRQSFVAEAPVVFVITGVYARTAGKYGERAARYVHIEAGHAAQNLLLVAESLGLGGVPVGAFVDDAVRRVIDAGEEETPLYVIPVGSPAR